METFESPNEGSLVRYDATKVITDVEFDPEAQVISQ
jgi:hypothetical protein